MLVMLGGRVLLDGAPHDLAEVARGRVWLSATRDPRAGLAWRTADGRFAFPNTPAPTDDRGLAVVATKAGRGSVVQPLWAEWIQKPWELRLRPAGTIQGRVTDQAGKPVAGAHVWTHPLGTGPLDGSGAAVGPGGKGDEQQQADDVDHRNGGDTRRWRAEEV